MPEEGLGDWGVAEWGREIRARTTVSATFHLGLGHFSCPFRERKREGVRERERERTHALP